MNWIRVIYLGYFIFISACTNNDPSTKGADEVAEDIEVGSEAVVESMRDGTYYTITYAAGDRDISNHLVIKYNHITMTELKEPGACVKLKDWQFEKLRVEDGTTWLPAICGTADGSVCEPGNYNIINNSTEWFGFRVYDNYKMAPSEYNSSSECIVLPELAEEDTDAEEDAEIGSEEVSISFTKSTDFNSSFAAGADSKVEADEGVKGAGAGAVVENADVVFAEVTEVDEVFEDADEGEFVKGAGAVFTQAAKSDEGVEDADVVFEGVDVVFEGADVVFEGSDVVFAEVTEVDEGVGGAGAVFAEVTEVDEVVTSPPILSVCDRTPEVRKAIIKEINKYTRIQNCSLMKSFLHHVVTLNFFDNNIPELKEGDFSGLSNLKELTLTFNQLSLLPQGIFSGLAVLEKLRLTGNQLSSSSFPEGIFSGLSALKQLDLRLNQFTVLSEGFLSQLLSLEYVDFSDNQIASIPEGFFSGPFSATLTHIRFKNNQIASIPEGLFSELPRLMSVDLSDNQLTSLYDGFFSAFMPGSYAILDGNQFSEEEIDRIVQDRIAADKKLSPAIFLNW